jgi:hypothetical protein
LPLEVMATGYGQMETAVIDFGIRPRKPDSASLQPAGVVR